ncbi:MAG: hypothetical protein OXS50_01995 [Gammaproteobacteria bacterium]|nr:hypothetical protein [Gammaproteobacteria bacterium]
MSAICSGRAGVPERPDTARRISSRAVGLYEQWKAEGLTLQVISDRIDALERLNGTAPDRPLLDAPQGARHPPVNG